MVGIEAWDNIDCGTIIFDCARCQHPVEEVSTYKDFDTLLLAVRVTCHGEEAKYKLAVRNLPKSFLCFKPGDIVRANARP